MVGTGISRERGHRFTCGSGHRRDRGSLLWRKPIPPDKGPQFLCERPAHWLSTGLWKALPCGWHGPQITALPRPPRDSWILTASWPVLPQAIKGIPTSVLSLPRLALPTPLPRFPSFYWAISSDSVVDFEIYLFVSLRHKHRCSVYLDCFSQYLVGHSASEKGSLHNHECLICAIIFFRNVNR